MSTSNALLRTKRDTTIIHRVRKRRPKHPSSRKKSRRQPSNSNRYPIQQKPIYGSPQYSTSININPPIFSSSDFTSPSKTQSDSIIPTYTSSFNSPSNHVGGSNFQSFASHSHANSINSIPAPTQYTLQSNSYIPPPPPPSPHAYFSSVGPSNHQLSALPSPQSSYFSNNSPRAVFHSKPVKIQKRPEPTFNAISTQGIPLSASLPIDPYNSQITSYDVPVNSYVQSNNIQPIQSQAPNNAFRPYPSTQYELQQNTIKSSIDPTSYASLLPVLPKHYEQNQFPTVQSQNILQPYNNQNSFLSEDSFEAYLNDVSESQRVDVKTKPKPKAKGSTSKPTKKKKESTSSEYSSFENFSEEFSLESFKNFIASTSSTTSTTTKRPKTTTRSRRRKRPTISTPAQHVLDTDDLKDAFESESEVREIFISPEEPMDFESKKFFKVGKTTTFVPSSKLHTTKTPVNYVLLKSQNNGSDEEESVKYVPKKSYKTESPTVKMSTYTYRPKRVSRPVKPNSDEVQDDGIDILSIQKSRSKSYYQGSEKENPKSSFEFTLPDNNDDFDVFETGVFVLNNGYGTRVKHGRSKKHLSDQFEDYTFEEEYEIEIPTSFNKK